MLGRTCSSTLLLRPETLAAPGSVTSILTNIIYKISRESVLSLTLFPVKLVSSNLLSSTPAYCSKAFSVFIHEAV
jgi:hypothetical protein